MITGNEASKMEYNPTIQIIENLMPENAQIILGGTTGANKSYMAMQMGMSLANNEKEFLGFKINVNGLKVLYCDTECGERILVNRYQEIKKQFNWSGGKKFNLLPRTKSSTDIYEDLESAIKVTKPNVVIIDCLYNTTNNVDMSKNHHISPILNKITSIIWTKPVHSKCFISFYIIPLIICYISYISSIKACNHNIMVKSIRFGLNVIN